MRRTITLDPDVDELLRRDMRERNVTFKQAVNDALRAGLKDGVQKRPRFRQRTFPMGKQLFPGHKTLAYAFELEDEALLKKMGLK